MPEVAAMMAQDKRADEDLTVSLLQSWQDRDVQYELICKTVVVRQKRKSVVVLVVLLCQTPSQSA